MTERLHEPTLQETDTIETLNGRKINVQWTEPENGEYTDETPIIFVNGYFEGIDMVSGAAAQVAAKGRRVLTYDNYRTSREKGEDSLERKVETFRAVLRHAREQNDGQPVHVMAHSEGAIVAMLAALAEYDDAVAKYGDHIPPETMGMLSMMLMMPAGCDSKHPVRRFIDVGFEAILTGPKRTKDMGRIAINAAKYIGSNPRLAVAELWKLARANDGPDLIALMGEFCPEVLMTVIVGTEDGVVSAERSIANIKASCGDKTPPIMKVKANHSDFPFTGRVIDEVYALLWERNRKPQANDAMEVAFKHSA